MSIESDVSLSKVEDSELLKRFKALIMSVLVGVIISVIAFISIINLNMDTLERDFVSDKAKALSQMNNDWQKLHFAILALQQFYLASDDVTPKDFDIFIAPYQMLPFNYLFSYSEKENKMLISDGNIKADTVKSLLPAKTAQIVSDEVSIMSSKEEESQLLSLIRATSKKDYILGGSINLQEILQPLQQSGTTTYIRHDNASEASFWKVNNSKISVIDAIPENIVQRSAFSHQDSLKLFDDTLHFIFIPSQQIYNEAANSLAWIVLAACLLVTTLISSFLYVIIGRNVKISYYADDLNKSQKALEISHVKLEQSNKDLDDFAYIASHDLKEPLRGLHNHAIFLMEDYEDKLDEDGVRRLNRFTHLTQRMESLINNLLYFSRLGRQELAFNHANIKELVADIEDMLEGYIQDNNVHINVQNDIPDIYCDSVRVTELFRNLITNAVKYNDKEITEITIGHCNERSHNGVTYQNVFFVADNGCGIEEEFYEDIFTIFKQLHHNKSADSTGSGLTFVKKIVERHHGTIWVESIMGAGTTFYFTLQGEHYESTNAAA